MRSIGSLENADLAERFAAYLITQNLPATVELEDGRWTIWVKDEDQIDEARKLLAEFEAAPGNPKYATALREAAARVREEERRRREIAKRMIDVRTRWSRGGARPARLTMFIIVVCVVIGFFTKFGGDPTNRALSALRTVGSYQTNEWSPANLGDRLIDIRRGQVWRLLTPNLVHYGPMHLAMNMFAFYVLGGHLESRRGPWTLLGLIIFCGLASTLGEALPPPSWGASVWSAGFSGVVFGLAGFIWVSMHRDPRHDLFMPPTWWMLVIVWFFLGAFGVLDAMGMNVANWAHGTGLVSGMAAGYFVSAWRAAQGP